MRVVRRQLVFLFVVATALSLAAQGRVVPWLVFDTAVSAAFMPAFQLLGFAVIWRARIAGSRPSQPETLRFLDGNAPWLWWWCAVAVPAAVVPTRSLGPWMLAIIISTLVPIVMSVREDMRWLRADCGRTTRQAALDVVGLRVVAWGAGIVWFFGIAIWYGELPKLAIWWRR